MSHHSNEGPLSPEDEALFKQCRAGEFTPTPPLDALDDLREAIRKQTKALNLGATREYPRGKLVDHDEGGIKISMGTYKNTVVVNFGTPVRSIGLSRVEALEFARIIMNHAETL